jgi:2-dehydro-3-deoxyphosphogluconate aldolase/(4S)-4-hydroxy-2-oxoglutarate aldolase
MARFRRLDVLNTILEGGLVPVFYNSDPDTAIETVKAVHRGGCRVFEFTNRGDFAPDVFAEIEHFCAAELPDMVTGVGSVTDPYTAALYIARGANFVVGPVFSPETARLCNRRKVAYSPGCGSASEIADAEECGCEIIKVFPGGQVGGPAFVKSVLGPMPWTMIMPTGGVDVTEESLTGWFNAGAACVGIGSKLITKDLVAARDFDGITANVERTVSLIDRIRNG